MIHDNASQFNLNYGFYNIRGIKTSIQAPNMNAIAERFVGSVRKEALDYFIIINKEQIRNIITEYVEYYNKMRPHQGIEQNIPQRPVTEKYGKISKTDILSGLHHHYFRMAA